jgi:hypothetical protein
MAGLGGGLVRASEEGPGDDVGGPPCRVDVQGVEEPAWFVDSDSDQVVRAAGGDGCCGGEERVGGDDQGDPAVPGFPPAVLVLVETEAGFRGL